MNRNGSQAVLADRSRRPAVHLHRGRRVGMIGGTAAAAAAATAVGGTGAPTAAAPDNAIRISIASSNTKEKWLHAAVDAFNAAAPTNAAFQVGRPAGVRRHPPGDDRRQAGGLSLRHDGLGHPGGQDQAHGALARRGVVDREVRARVRGRQQRRQPDQGVEQPARRAHAARHRHVGVARQGPRLLADAGTRLHLEGASRAGGQPGRLGCLPAPGVAQVPVRLRLLRGVELGHPRGPRDVPLGPGQDRRASRSPMSSRPTAAASSSPTSRRPRSTAASPTPG